MTNLLHLATLTTVIAVATWYAARWLFELGARLSRRISGMKDKEPISRRRGFVNIAWGITALVGCLLLVLGVSSCGQ